MTDKEKTDETTKKTEADKPSAPPAAKAGPPKTQEAAKAEPPKAAQASKPAPATKPEDKPKPAEAAVEKPKEAAAQPATPKKEAAAAKPAPEKPKEAAAQPAASKKEAPAAKPAAADGVKKSGLFYPNRMAGIVLRALEDVMGKNGLKALLSLAKLPHFIDKLPPDNLNREFDFADFSALVGALEDMYGMRGGRGLALRAGRATFAQGLKDFGALAGAGDLAFKVLPLAAKLKIGVPAMAKVFSAVSDQKTRIEEKEKEIHYIIEVCPVCWGRKTEVPTCHVAVGLLQEGLRWVSGGHEFRVGETKCIGKGDKECVFVIEKEPIG